MKTVTISELKGNHLQKLNLSTISHNHFVIREKSHLLKNQKQTRQDLRNGNGYLCTKNDDIFIDIIIFFFSKPLSLRGKPQMLKNQKHLRQKCECQQMNRESLHCKAFDVVLLNYIESLVFWFCIIEIMNLEVSKETPSNQLPRKQKRINFV